VFPRYVPRLHVPVNQAGVDHEMFWNPAPEKQRNESTHGHELSRKSSQTALTTASAGSRSPQGLVPKNGTTESPSIADKTGTIVWQNMTYWSNRTKMNHTVSAALRILTISHQK
jgi:hypothetical protein